MEAEGIRFEVNSEVGGNISVEKVKKELTYYISEAEEIEIDSIQRPLIVDSDEE